MLNNNLEQQAVLLFKEWFTDFVNTSSNLIETRFGLIPDTFRLLKNGELKIVVTDYVANGSFASLKANVTLYQEPNYAYFIRNTDLKSGSFEVFVDEHSYRFLSKSTLYGGEIIISNVGDVGSVFLCPKLKKPMTLGNNIIMLRSEQDNLKYYLYIWFKWLYGQSLIQGIKGGSAQPKFNKTDFKSLPIFLPPDDLLERFHQTVKPMFELIEKNNEENQGLRVIRDTLLPKLISGELDVSNIDF
jgi:putative type I site-specific deoxyribonuclease